MAATDRRSDACTRPDTEGIARAGGGIRARSPVRGAALVDAIAPGLRTRNDQIESASAARRGAPQPSRRHSPSTRPASGRTTPPRRGCGGRSTRLRYRDQRRQRCRARCRATSSVSGWVPAAGVPTSAHSVACARLSTCTRSNGVRPWSIQLNGRRTLATSVCTASTRMFEQSWGATRSARSRAGAAYRPATTLGDPTRRRRSQVGGSATGRRSRRCRAGRHALQHRFGRIWMKRFTLRDDPCRYQAG